MICFHKLERAELGRWPQTFPGYRCSKCGRVFFGLRVKKTALGYHLVARRIASRAGNFRRRNLLTMFSEMCNNV